MIKIQAPGRTEIGGNHTDHQHGCVLAAAVNLACTVVAEKAEKVTIHDPKHGEQSQKLIDGIVEYFAKNGYKTGGFEATITSDVLVGSGLSSSAAFEVGIAKTLSVLYNNDAVPPIELAKAGQYAENVFLKKPSGLMDQTASAFGGLVFIDFADPSSPFAETIGVDFDAFGHILCITDTKGSHADLTAEYAAIPQEMNAVAEYFGAKVLRETDENSLLQNVSKLRERFGDRAVLRALHFFDENKRAKQEADALKNADFDTFLRLVNESGNSSFMNLQNAYSLKSQRNQGIPLALAVSKRILQNSGAVRLHGGGFAGTIQAFVPCELLEKYVQTLDGVFGENACSAMKIIKEGAVLCQF